MELRENRGGREELGRDRIRTLRRIFVDDSCTQRNGAFAKGKMGQREGL